ncbi:MAG: peptide chain release factor 3 [Bacteroidia bacterium]|nr:peptide chain release factor 3 [Bacteroidia bacterium]
MTRLDEIARRRTFAIISHPDAGKTTLTEKLLLFGGAIQVAGAVKSNKINRATVSDFMEIERQRGISVATSVMGFEYKGLKINILDTPGHQDFAEDTYRTLTAVDSVIVVVDVAKGVETQTEKLVQVCRMRDTPIIVFINKLDREGKDPYDLLDEVEQKLGLRLRPLSWPAGMGKSFRGVYDLFEQKLVLFTPHSKQTDEDSVVVTDLSDEILDRRLGSQADKLREDIDLIEGVYDPFDQEAYLQGKLSPVFFGSAVNNFGVRELLDCFIRIAPKPGKTPAEERAVQPEDEKFTGFVFKIHANMDPNHRNRLAFVKVCSGIFERNKAYTHVRLGKQLKFNAPTAFMADKKTVVDEAFPGDVVGLYDTGNFRIGDTLTEGEDLNVTGIPSFSPEIFRFVENADPMKSKQLAKGLEQLMDEGVVQLFTQQINGRKIVGAVGALQLEVLEYRLKHEYGATCRYEPVDLYRACWISAESQTELATFRQRKARNMAQDKFGNDVFLASSSWDLNSTQELFPKIKFHFTSEF